jgi:hypothetical protein
VRVSFEVGGSGWSSEVWCVGVGQLCEEKDVDDTRMFTELEPSWLDVVGGRCMSWQRRLRAMTSSFCRLPQDQPHARGTILRLSLFDVYHVTASYQLVSKSIPGSCCGSV